MHRWKTALILLLTLAMAVGGFLLPGFTTQIVDSASADAVYSQNFTIASPAPAPDRNQAADSLYRLSLLEFGNMVPLVENLGTKTSEEIEALSETFRATLADLGLIIDDFLLSSVNLYLCMNTRDPSDYILVWKVSYGGGTKQEANYFDVVIDDETGKLLHVYHSYHEEQWDIQARMEVLVDYYFSQLGLDPNEYFYTGNAVGGKKSFAYRVYILPAGENLRTEIQLEMDIYYFKTSINHYQADIIEP